MSLSRPARFPLLKLPWLCIKRVLHNSDEFVLIYIATISNRTRRIVRSLNYPLKEIDVYPSRGRMISFGSKLEKRENKIFWYFMHDAFEYSDGSFSLQRNSEPFRTCRGFGSETGNFLHSYTTGDELDALKSGIKFMIDVFGCKIRKAFVDGNKVLELIGLGISFFKELYISYSVTVDKEHLKYLLETVKVTDEFVFFAPIPEDFYCDPQIFKSQKLSFSQKNSADWVTLEVLCQFNVAQLSFSHHRFTAEDIVSYITHWFNSENRKLEFLFVQFDYLTKLGALNIDHLNPMRFCEKRRNRHPLKGAEPWETTDLSSGMDILRKDDLLATVHVRPEFVFFYVWHKRFPDGI